MSTTNSNVRKICFYPDSVCNNVFLQPDSRTVGPSVRFCPYLPLFIREIRHETNCTRPIDYYMYIILAIQSSFFRRVFIHINDPTAARYYTLQSTIHRGGLIPWRAKEILATGLISFADKISAGSPNREKFSQRINKTVRENARRKKKTRKCRKT